MTSIAALPANTPGARRDYYTEFIEDSRWLRHEQAMARTNWFAALPSKNKSQHLFEFEMLLKGLVCFGNPVNHPGPPTRGEPVAARTFGDELGIVEVLIQRILEIGRALSNGQERSRIFQRYLESIIAQDEARFHMVKQSLTQDTPEQSFKLLIQSMRNILEVTGGLLKVPEVSYQLFSSVIEMTQREVHRSMFFDPLAALEFRAEFDRIKPEKPLRLIRRIPSEPARRVVTLTFLAIFRLLKYLDSIENVPRRGQPLGVLFGWLAVLRSDTRALTIFFKRDTSTWLSTGFGRLFEQLEPNGVKKRYNQFEAEFKMLRSLGELLVSIGDQLRLEQRKVFEQQLPAIGDIDSLETFAVRVSSAIKSTRAFLQNATVLIAKEFDTGVDGNEIYSDFVSASTQSDRLRRDIWMFQQILRAFIVKAKSSAKTADQWSGSDSFHFVRQFVSYFRSMGYQLLRYSDYERFDRFMNLVDRLREGDVLQVQRVSRVVDACSDFQTYLEQTFDAVGKREELRNIPFDKKEAARTLKLFLNR